MTAILNRVNIYNQSYPEGDSVDVFANTHYVEIEIIDTTDADTMEGVLMGRDEAIAAARAILKHFNATLESAQ